MPWVFVFHWAAMLVVGWVALTLPKCGGAPPIPWRRWKGLRPAFLMSVVCVVVLYLEICGVIYLLLRLREQATRFGPYAFVFGPSLMLISFIVSVVVWIGLSGRITKDAQREWWTRFGAWLTMFTVVGLVLAGLAVFGPRLVLLVVHPDPGSPYKNLLASVKWTSVLGWLGTVIGGLL
jgi:hypothetical protein